LSQSLKFKLLPKGSIHSLHISHAEQLRSHFIKIVNKENRKPPELIGEGGEVMEKRSAYHSIESNTSLHDPNCPHHQHLPIPLTNQINKQSREGRQRGS
jgi:hypothetical protein